MKAIIKEFKSNPILWLVISVPVALFMKFTHSDANTVLFILSIVAIIPLAALLSQATEAIAIKTGDTIGGLLNATFGNITEMAIFILALRQGLVDLVKASIAGAIVTNSLFMLGMSYLLGGLRYKTQNYNQLNAFIQSSLLFIVCIALLIPAIINIITPDRHPETMNRISSGIAVILMIIYLLGLLFSLKTHVGFFKSATQATDEEEPHWSIKTSLTVLIVSTICIALISEIFVDGIQEFSIQIGLSQAFAGFIIVPLVGAAAEMTAAFSAARKNKLDISVNIAMGSSVQIALFITPLMIILSHFIAPSSMNLDFKAGQVFVILCATLSVSLISNQGKSNWYLGVLLISVYSIFCITLFFLK